MNHVRLALVLGSCAFLMACFCGQQCLALCVPTITVSLRDAQDAGVAPGTGSVTVDGVTQTFDCSPPTFGSRPDGGPAVSVSCGATELIITDFTGMPSELTLDVTQAGGFARFSGPVPSTFGAPRNVCGTMCTDATATVTLR